MLDENKMIMNFLLALAEMRRDFHGLKLEINKWAGVSAASQTFTVSGASNGRDFDRTYSDRGITLLMALDSTVNKEGPEGQHSMGVSVLLRFPENRWLVEGEIGWTSTEVGWDQFIEDALSAHDIGSVIDKLPDFTRAMLASYKKALKAHLQG